MESATMIIFSGARRDEDGYIWITGRVDDMLNVSGHLMSTAEVESCLAKHPSVAEAAVVSRPHPVKGECLYCFVTLNQGIRFNDKLSNELKLLGMYLLSTLQYYLYVLCFMILICFHCGT